MDPLSITASVAGIVSLAGSVYQGISKYIRTVKDARKEVLDLASETRNIFGLLNNLSLLVSHLEHDQVPSALQHSHLNDCRQALYTIDLGVSRAFEDFQRGSKTDALLRRLRWPFSKQDTMDMIQQLSRHKDNISLALSADSMTQLLELLSTQKHIEQAVDGIGKTVADVQASTEIVVRTILDQRDRQVIDFFQTVNPQSKLELSIEMRQPMTGLWLIDGVRFQLWKEQPNAKIWLSGIPGSGKTILCGAIIQDVLQLSSHNTAVAFFFCDYAVPESHLPVQVLGSLAVQLALQHQAAFEILKEYYDELHPVGGLTKPARVAQMIDLFRRLAAKFDKVFVVVDALDECGQSAVDVVKALTDITERGRNISTALLSRDEEHIRSRLEDDYSNIEIAAQDDDLRRYLEAQMAQRSLFSRMLLRQPDLYQEIRRSLLDGANGMFRWVACQLDYLESLPSNYKRRSALKKLPPTLFQTYQRILDAAFDENGTDEARDLIRKTLHWIAVSSPPLTISQLCDAVSYSDENDVGDTDDVDNEDIEDIEYGILRVCGSLIRKTRDGKRFEFAHFTVREFLETIPPSSSLATFRLSRPSAVRSLALVCLRCFLRRDGEDDPGHHPFYEYAVSGWLLYTNSCLDDESVMRLVFRLFDEAKTPQFCRFAAATSAYVMGHDVFSVGTNDGTDDRRFLNIRAADLTTLHFAALLGIP